MNTPDHITSDGPTLQPQLLTSPRMPKSSLAWGLVWAVVGAGLSLQTLLHHIAVRASGSTDAMCNVNATVNCDKVALSPYAEIFSVPLGVWGIGYFVAAAILLWIGASAMKSAKEHMLAYSAMAVVGVGASVVLGFIAYGLIGAVCLYCTGIYVTTVVMAIHLWMNRRFIPGGASVTSLVNGGSTAVIVVAVCALAWSWLKPAPTVLPATDTATDVMTEQPKVDLPIDRSPYSGRGEDYRMGSNEAPVEFVEFADFQCPPCRFLSEQVHQLAAEFPNEVQIVFKNYPLDPKCSSTGGGMHQYACEAALIGRCVGAAGKFWEYYRLVYDNQDAINSKTLRGWAAKLGVSGSDLEACVKSPDTMAKIKDDIALGDKVGVSGTPTMFINKRRFNGGMAYPALRAAIQNALKQGAQ